MRNLWYLAALANEKICSDPNVDADLKSQAGCSENGTLGNSLLGIIQVGIGLVGLLAACVIIYGGIQYTISLGDAGKAKTAKQTIFYGVIGMILAVMSFAIVSFVSANVL